jgi:hypothetical protein
MKRFLFGTITAALVLAFSVPANAQSRGRHGSVQPASSPSSARVVRMAQPRGIVRQSDAGFLVSNSSVALLNAIPIETFPTPGLGFDFPHLAAVSRMKVSDISVLSTAQRLALARRLMPLAPIGLPFFQAEPQVIIVQQPAPVVVLQPAAAEEAAAPAPPTRPAASASAEAQPARDVGEFVLVRRDGKILFAVAFTIAGGQLTYVTPEGIRRSVALADLDVESTERMNEERGTTIRLPV